LKAANGSGPALKAATNYDVGGDRQRCGAATPLPKPCRNHLAPRLQPDSIGRASPRAFPGTRMRSMPRRLWPSTSLRLVERAREVTRFSLHDLGSALRAAF